MDLIEIFNKLSSIEEDVLTEEREEDIEEFDNKFGEGSFEKFNKLKGRLKNNNISVDIVYHIKNTPVDKMNIILSDAEKRVVKDVSGETKLNRKLVTSNEYYDVYDVLDWETSMNMGDGTGWCISGRYDTDEVKPSQAKQYFNQYKEQGIEHFLFLMPKKDGVMKYCLCIEKNGDFQFWDAEDKGLNISKTPNSDMIPYIDYGGVKIIPPRLVNGLIIKGDEVVGADYDIVHAVIPHGVTTIGDDAFLNCIDMTSTTIPDSVTSIGKSAFDGCISLPSVTIPGSVKSIGYRAFNGCTGLTSVTILDGVTYIGDDAFKDCTKLKSVKIPDSVKSIGAWAFLYCKSLTSVTIPNSVTTIGKYAFKGCSNLTSVTVPDSVTSIGEGAFFRCTGLTSVAIHDGVKSIGAWSFFGCNSLTSVTIPDSVMSIEVGAFDGCKNLTIRCNHGSYAEKYARNNNIPIEYTD